MKVALFNSIFGEADNYLKHGIGMISSNLKRAGHETVLINCYRRDQFNIDDVDIVGIGGLTSCIPEILSIAEMAKTVNPDVPVFVGGVGPTFSPEYFENQKDVDYIFLGEAEKTFIEIVDEYEKSGKLPKEKTIRGEVIRDVDTLAFVDRSRFINGEQPYVMVQDIPMPMYSMFNSRWCRKKCKFCAPAMSTMFGGIKKLRTVNNFITELATLPTDYMTMMVHDDNMIENVEWCKEMVVQFEDRDWFIPFICQAYPGEVVKNPKLLETLQEAGLVGVLVGFESGSNRMLRYMKKGTTRKINIEAAEILHGLGIRVQANIMFGNPTETYGEMMDTVSLYNDHIYKPGWTIPSQAIYTPYPGSTWYEELKEQGEINITDFKQYERYMHTRGKLRSVDYDAAEKAIRQLVPFPGLERVI